MLVKEITLKEYNNFTKTYPCNPFQSEGMYHRLAKPKIFGGFVENELVITAMGGYKPIKKIFNYFYIPYGPIAKDPLDYNLLKDFYQSLNKKHKLTNTIAIATDPAIEMNLMNGFGEIQPGYDNSEYRNKMKDIGFTILPLTYETSKMTNPRQVAILDLAELENYKGVITNSTKPKHIYTDEELLSNMKPRTLRYIKQANVDYIKVEDSDIDTLIYCGSKSGEAKNFEFFKRENLEEIVQGYGKDCAIRHCYIDTEEYAKHILEEIEEINKEIERLRKTNANKKIKAQQEKLDTCNRKLKEIQYWATDKLSLCCGLFLYSERETYFLASGIDRKYRKYNGANRLNWDEIVRSKERGVWKYNMLGIAGHYTKDDPNESLISFKRDLGCHIAEYQGMMFMKVHSWCFDDLVNMYWNKS